MGAANSRISTSQSHQDFNGFTTVDRGNYGKSFLNILVPLKSFRSNSHLLITYIQLKVYTRM